MSPEVKAALIGVGGALLVWVASWLWTWHVDRRTRKNVRAMLGMEVEENLQALRVWQQRAREQVNFEQGHLMAGVQHVDAVRNLKFPAWSRRVWQEGMHLIPIALDEEEIRQVHRFHQKLDELAEIQAQNDPKQSRSELAKLVDQVVDDLLAGGNPLSQP
jgi:hypothetical protein